MTNGGNPNPPKDKSDSALTAAKEGVTATLGIIIIIATIILMWPSLSSGDSTKLPMAQGIFAILGGWGGIILGYYFGRLPSEKAADTANKVTDKANQAADTARQVANQAGQTAIVAQEQTKTAQQQANSVISNCTSLLEKTSISLKQLSTGAGGTTAKSGLVGITAGIDAQIQEIDYEIKKLREMSIASH
jgi:hypothetical protein